MAAESRFLNRELSWLEFNQRVLDEAKDASVPVLDRLFLLSVTDSNLEEFFMVRVGGLKLQIEGGVTTPDASGLTPREQYRRILERVRRMVADQYACLAHGLLPDMARQGLRLVAPEDFTPAQRAFVEHYLEDTVLSTLSPLAVEPDAGPVWVSGGLYMAFALEPERADGAPRLAVMRLVPGLPRFLALPGEDGAQEVALIEAVVQAGASRFFLGRTVQSCACFRVMRNADILVREEYAENLAVEMEEVLRLRRRSGAVRLDLSAGIDPFLRDWLVECTGVAEEGVFEIPGPLDLGGFAELSRWDSLAHLREAPWPPQPCAQLDPAEGIFDAIANRDLLLCLPFERFDPVLRLVEEAATDPDVLAIKIILYRTGSRSPIVRSLIAAAASGKSVTAVVELKARFDEASNIAWAREMEAAGVQVLLGVRGLKTHAKACMVVRREDGAIVRYLHLGTGNYNATTARQYTDVGLLTCNVALGADLAAFFHAITGYSEPQNYQKLAQAPLTLRDRLLTLIESETQRAAAGQPAWIQAKMNALVDPALVEALYRASQAGVEIQLNVRGICVLRPGVPGLSERIRVVSIIDRFLEHSRILRFHHGGDDLVFLSSADWMPRNLDRRVELLVPVEDPDCRARLVRILAVCLADTAKGRELLADGGYRPPAGGDEALRSQARLYQEACEASRQRARVRPIRFEPHRLQQAAKVGDARKKGRRKT